MATKLLEKQEIQGIDINLLKKKLLEKFEDTVNSSDNREKLLEARENYLKKREAIIEAALRIVKKIVNDENEYKKFEKEYLKRNKYLYLVFLVFQLSYLNPHLDNCHIH